ncbi:STIP1 y and U box-containing protein 1 [Mortierella hygrophila]|uniref:RING-type E3 ubiquitin transferase n=1 Tax=Mortierella hygrophila TaxID=979708 RepID=A0A9P6F555_9FUNG|nr:STIP1 y and U box-containing protein 1 [Mortierella hygrophila]
MTAEQHKLRGNEFFKAKDLDQAIHEYSTAIVKDPKVAVYYQNRANCYLKLEKYTSVVSDCERVVELDKKSVKGYYFMGKAHLELGQPSEAYSLLKKSYELALEQRSAFTKDIVAIIAEAKKQRWIEQERRRISQVSETYRYLSGLIEQDIQRQVDALDRGSFDYQDYLTDLRSDKEERLKELEAMTQRAGIPDDYVRPYIERKKSTTNNNNGVISPEASPDPSSAMDINQEPYKKPILAPAAPREVPDHLLDKITFELMHDPVISMKSGISYERNTLLEHFSYGRMFDPVAQVPMTERDIIPNRALKEACEDFLTKNGWAVDY